jgi:hypothetical protein
LPEKSDILRAMFKPMDLFNVVFTLFLIGLGVKMKADDLAILCFGAAGLVALFGLYQHITRPHLRRIITAIGGGVAVSLIVVFLQRFRSIPNDRVLLAAIFCAAAVILYLLGLFRTASAEKPSPPSGTQPLHDRIAELEGEKTALEEARDNAIRARETMGKEVGRLEHLARTHSVRADLNQQLLDQNKAQYGWLHEAAEGDKRNISKYVYIIFRKVKYEGLDEIEPYIEIFFDIINASVYNIIIDKGIQDGAVYFNDKELNPKQAKLGGSLHSISRDERKQRFLVIKQWISQELAKRIKNPLPDDKLYFDRLWLNVGAANNSEVDSGRLSLPSHIPVEISANPTAEIAALKSELEERDKDKLIRESIGLLISEGRQFTKQRLALLSAEESEKAREWLSKAEASLKGYLDHSYLVRFEVQGEKKFPHMSDRVERWEIEMRLTKLEEFIKELKTH